MIITPTKTPKILVPEIKTDVLGIGDLHIPFHDAKWLTKVVDLAMEWDVSTLALVGDVIDGNGVSSYIGSDVTISQEIASYKKFESEIAPLFKSIVWSKGNHEDRYIRRQHVMPDGRNTTKDFDSLSELLEEYFVDAPNVSVYDAAIIKIRIGNKKWHFEHPQSSNSQAATVARGIAAKLHENVATWHTHRRGYNHDVSSNFYAVDVGACADFSKLSYTQQITFGKDAMQQGAFIIKKDGKNVDHHILTPESNFARLRKFYG